MSAANGATEKKDTYLQHVSLKNYKSIKDVEIDFKPGLNIIIGKNASGKTNFVNGLDAILGFNYDEILDAESIIKAYFDHEKIEIQSIIKDQTVQDLLKRDYYNLFLNHIVSLKINNNIKDTNKNDINAVQEYLVKMNWFFNKVLIKYGTGHDENDPFIYNPFKFVLVHDDKFSSRLFSVRNKNNSHFINSLFHRLHLSLLEMYDGVSKSNVANQSFKDTISLFFERRFRNINNEIFNYSPIKEIRLNPNFDIIDEENGKKKTVINFYLDFKVDNSWLPFNLLSDGTKRLFYILSEMSSDETTNNNTDLNIILLEEPELGIHPHQLHKLMQFIKEQSREKQIIITTHSPQVLDILEPDELDRIIICHSDPKNGTKLSHLTEREIAKAKKYMQEEAYLSDYWRFSDLEPAS